MFWHNKAWLDYGQPLSLIRKTKIIDDWIDTPFRQYWVLAQIFPAKIDHLHCIMAASGSTEVKGHERGIDYKENMADAAVLYRQAHLIDMFDWPLNLPLSDESNQSIKEEIENENWGSLHRLIASTQNAKDKLRVEMYILSRDLLYYEFSNQLAPAVDFALLAEVIFDYYFSDDLFIEIVDDIARYDHINILVSLLSDSHSFIWLHDKVIHHILTELLPTLPPKYQATIYDLLQNSPDVSLALLIKMRFECGWFK
jgi:hypothetical protein